MYIISSLLFDSQLPVVFYFNQNVDAQSCAPKGAWAERSVRMLLPKPQWTRFLPFMSAAWTVSQTQAGPFGAQDCRLAIGLNAMENLLADVVVQLCWETSWCSLVASHYHHSLQPSHLTSHPSQHQGLQIMSNSHTQEHTCRVCLPGFKGTTLTNKKEH